MASFIDTNVQMYAVGGPHELRTPSIQVLRLAAARPEAFFTDSEVLQEILHRYFSLRRRAEGRDKMRDFADLMHGRIEPTFTEDVVRAGDLAMEYAGLSARDCVHLAIMERVGCHSVVTADRGFERVAGMRRLHPRDLSSWRHEFGL
ncbi:MAG TPA: type II toxin-antitoxin system VapC family toxin [Chloroflexota bacterium]